MDRSWSRLFAVSTDIAYMRPNGTNTQSPEPLDKAGASVRHLGIVAGWQIHTSTAAGSGG
jgi:hypothetical protein